MLFSFCKGGVEMRVLFCIPGYPQTHFEVKSDPNFIALLLPQPPSCMLGLQAWAIHLAYCVPFIKDDETETEMIHRDLQASGLKPSCICLWAPSCSPLHCLSLLLKTGASYIKEMQVKSSRGPEEAGGPSVGMESELLEGRQCINSRLKPRVDYGRRQ